MSDATISSTSPGPEARGRDSPPGSPVAQFDRHAGNDVVHGPDRDVRAKRRRSLTDNEIRELPIGSAATAVSLREISRSSTCC